MRTLALRATSALALLLATPPALAGEFDPQGNFLFAPQALVSEGFETLVGFEPAFVDAGVPNGIEWLEPVDSADALEGSRYARVATSHNWDQAVIPVSLSAAQQSVRVRLWMRHNEINATFVVRYASSSGKRQTAALTPTGRCTSDGWVELESARVSIDGGDVSSAYLAIRGRGEIDALEVVTDGAFHEATACRRAFDPVCGSERFCAAGWCRDGAHFVPGLPPPHERDQVVDWIESRLRFAFGGHETRTKYLPLALEELAGMRHANSAWEFWNGFGTAIRKLHDWHTAASSLASSIRAPASLNLCFIEGDADLSHAIWPSDPRYRDLMIAYTGKDRTAGMKRGDRLVSIDGMHPIAWARSLITIDWGWWQADDDRTNAEFAERLRGLIPRFAESITVLHCDEATLSCSPTPETIQIASLPEDDADARELVTCDNRPAYHLTDTEVPNPETHAVNYNIFIGPLADSQPGENLWGMTWDTLWGPAFESTFLGLGKKFKDNGVRGVVLDHRAGMGGTLDAPEAMTRFVREFSKMGLGIYFRPSAGFEGPATPEEGIAIYEKYQKDLDAVYDVGGDDADTELPVALLLHRDGSASDYMPWGMKGAPKVRLFGQGPTAGAFSTLAGLSFWGSLSMQLAHGEAVSADGLGMIARGVEPDEIVAQKQSDLIRGRDTVYERALAWVRSEMKP